jgi:hypothetical protein
MNPEANSSRRGGHAGLSARKHLIKRPPTGRTSVLCLQRTDTNPPVESTRYRASLPIMVLAFRDNHHAAVTIPAGEVFEVIGPEPNDDRFIIVKVNGQELLVFESDLKQRGKLVYKEQAKGA